jgi:hypothetical protein
VYRFGYGAGYSTNYFACKEFSEVVRHSGWVGRWKKEHFGGRRRRLGRDPDRVRGSPASKHGSGGWRMGGRRNRGEGERGGGGRGGAERRGGRSDAGGPPGRGGEDEGGYRQRVNERFDRLAERVARLEEEVRQLRGGGEGGGSRRA